MKKSNLLLVIFALAVSNAFAQITDGIVLQPTHIIGKRINSSGEIIKTLESDFSYSGDGKPAEYLFSEYALRTNYSFEGDYLIKEYTMHNGGWPVFGESLNYEYEDGRVKTITHLWGQMNANEYWQYEYYEDGRLKQMDYEEDIITPSEYHQHYLYDYENEGRTKIESYWTSWPIEGTVLRRKTTSQYDELFRVVTENVENYSVEGDLTSSRMTTYSYTESGKEESRIEQVLTNGEWVNSTIQRFTYDDLDQIIEQENGSWSASNGDWEITRKIIFEFSEDGKTYTVSFYKKSEEQWVWDVFNNQTILFPSYLKIQQRALRYYMYEDMNGGGSINQFEFMLEAFEEPVYLNVTEDKENACVAYPNPGNSVVKLETNTMDAVVRFYDLQGKLMVTKPFDFNIEVSTENWPSGMYVWEIWHGNQKEASGKWIKE